MKLSKFAQTAKRFGMCAEYRVERDCVWLSNGYAIYRAAGLPEFYGREQARAVLSLDEKQMEKIVFREIDCADLFDVQGMNLNETDAQEKDTKPVNVVAIVGGKYASAVIAKDGETVFYDNALLSPLSDVMKDSDYMEMTIRQTASGQRYIAVKDGMMMLAALMPMQIVSDKYLADLAEYQAICTDQLFRERARAAATTTEQPEEPAEQTELEEQTDED